MSYVAVTPTAVVWSAGWRLTVVSLSLGGSGGSSTVICAVALSSSVKTPWA
jgi:hypothetical protein